MKANITLKIFTGFVLIFFLSSCVTESLHSISDPDKAVIDNRLTGTWTGKIEETDGFIHFLPQIDGRMEVVTVSFDNDKERIGEWSIISMFTSNIGNQSYMNLKFIAEVDEPVLKAQKTFFLCRYHISNDNKLMIWRMANSATKAAIESGLKGDGKKITATTSELSEFIRKSDPEQLFGKPVGTFSRLNQ